MPRIRTVKPEMAHNEELAATSIEAQLLAIRLLNHADDEGYFKANPALVKAVCFPLVDSVNIQGCLSELSNAGYLRLTTGTDGKQYGHIRKFTTHQKINRAKESKIRELWCDNRESVKDHGRVSDPSLPEGNREQGKEQGKEERGADAQTAPQKPPGKTKRRSRLPDDFDLDEARLAYIRDKRPELDPHAVFENFRDYHLAKGNLMADWDRAWMRWVRNETNAATRSRTGETAVQARERRNREALAGNC